MHRKWKMSLKNCTLWRYLQFFFELLLFFGKIFFVVFKLCEFLSRKFLVLRGIRNIFSKDSTIPGLFVDLFISLWLILQSMVLVLKDRLQKRKKKEYFLFYCFVFRKSYGSTRQRFEPTTSGSWGMCSTIVLQPLLDIHYISMVRFFREGFWGSRQD